MILIKIIALIDYFKYEYYNKESCIKYNIIIVIIYLFLNIYIFEFIKKQKLNKKLEALSIYQKEIINNYHLIMKMKNMQK